ncbi:hypothetical protein [Bacillus cereus]|uniref:hypothetical protein n=1 Tax=Bacillus cereus TaxID=1396 RepID=UPI000BF4BD5F|nr:hypothetical protein [Bacillus cereus]PFN17794.1 hypothetical protein COJ69_28975 [Bacillus cereus]
MYPTDYMYTRNCCGGSKNHPMITHFLADPPLSITRTITYYKDLQQQNQFALAPLVKDLNDGIKVPLPCPNDPNSPCVPPGGGIKTASFFAIIDQLKGCVGFWAIFFLGPTLNGPFILLTVFISSLEQDPAGNVLAMNYFLPGNNLPQRITIQNLINNGLRAVQC